MSKRFPLLPRSWFKTLRLGYALSSKLGLHAHVRLFKEILNAYNSHDVDMDKIALLSFRFIHEFFFSLFTSRHIPLCRSVRAIISLAKIVIGSNNVESSFCLSVGRLFSRL